LADAKIAIRQWHSSSIKDKTMAQTVQFVQEILDLVQSQERMQKEVSQERNKTAAIQQQFDNEKVQLQNRITHLERAVAERNDAIKKLQAQVLEGDARLTATQSELAARFSEQAKVMQKAHKQEIERKEQAYRRAFQEAIESKESAYQAKTKQILDWKIQAEARLIEVGREKQRIFPENQRLKAQNESLQQALERDESEIKKLQSQMQSLFSEREEMRARFLHEMKLVQAQAQKNASETQAFSLECKKLRQQILAQNRRIQELEQELDHVKRRAPLSELLTIKTDQIARLQADLEQPWLQSGAAREMIQEKIDELDQVRKQITSELNH